MRSWLKAQCIPYSLAHRLVRNCSQRESLEIRLEELKEMLLSCGYRIKVIDAAFERARSLDRGEALKKVVREEDIKEFFDGMKKNKKMKSGGPPPSCK